MADDVRISSWDLRASAGTTVALEFTSTEALTSLAVYTGGTLTDVDDLTDATAYTATLSGGNLVATVEVDVPTGNSVPLRLIVDGAVQSVGRLIPSTSGTASPDNTITLTPGSFAFDLTVLGIVTYEGGGGGTDDQTAAEVAFTPTGTIAATDVQAAIAEVSGDVTTEATARAAADTALDGRLDTIEADYLQAADITGMETTAGAQAKADAAQAYAVQRANHTGTQTSATISDFTEAVQDAVAALLGAGSNITLTYNDATDTLTIDATGGGSSYTDEEVRDAIGVALVGAGLISVTPNDALDTITVSTTATANSTDAALRDRSTHTGEQAIATVTGLQAALDAKQPLDADLTALAAAGNSAVLAATTASFTTADETKLDGIETGATADQTAAEILAALLTVDGAGSGLDADLLDGQSSAAFATAAQGATADTALQPGDIGVTVQGYDANNVSGDGTISDVVALTQAEYDALTPVATTLYVITDAVQTAPVTLGFAISDETTSITTGTAKLTAVAPFDFTLTEVIASLSTASSSGAPAFDVNDDGVSVFSTTVTIDANERTSTTAATAAVISQPTIAKGSILTFDIDTAGTGAKGAKLWLIGTRDL
jgi:hypothetical protein